MKCELALGEIGKGRAWGGPVREPVLGLESRNSQTGPNRTIAADLARLAAGAGANCDLTAGLVLTA